MTNDKTVNNNENHKKENEGLVGVTSCLGCRRSLFYRHNDTPKLPPHYWSFRGIMTHSMIEECIRTGEMTDQDLGEVYDYTLWMMGNDGNLPGYAKSPKLKREVLNIMEKFKTWANETEHNFKRVELYLVSKDKRFHGRIDLIDGDTLIDFKSGKTVTKKSRLQLAAYKILCEDNGIPINRLKLVMLGKDTGNVEVNVLGREGDFDKYRAEFLEDLDIAENVVKGSELPEAEMGIECSFCPYAHICRGI